MNQQLINFISEQTGVEPEDIKPEAGFEDDLGVFGDDTVELVIAYAERFNVDISNFIFKKYISPEGDTLLPTIIRLFTGKEPDKQKELTVGHLEKGIIAGRLDEEVIYA